MRRKIIVLLILSLISLSAFPQKGVTFKVEKLTPPTQKLEMEYPGEFYDQASETIIAHGPFPDSLAQFYYSGNNSFILAIDFAFADHRPVVLSPDVVWLLICQGFANHININSESLRDKLVDFNGQATLAIRDDSLLLDDPDAPWAEAVDRMVSEIEKNTTSDITRIFRTNFTTTTPNELMVQNATAMKAMESYFTYTMIESGCGIPEITLLGTPADWKLIREKTRLLAKYDAKWWTDQLDPVLAQFVNASEGRVDAKFWQSMYKIRRGKEYEPDIINGWIIKFFPYDKFTNRSEFKGLDTFSFPRGRMEVRIKHISLQFNTETNLCLSSGFFGFTENPKTLAITPYIGWNLIKIDAPSWSEIISLRVREIPQDILSLNEINQLDIEFIDSINIPEQLGQIKIRTLRAKGTIDEQGIERIRKLFPRTHISINDEYYESLEEPFEWE